MKFTESPLAGAFVIDLEPIEDERGFFARTFCVDDFAPHTGPIEIVQCNLSSNVRRGTLRGMHFQAAPHEEGKIVRCVRGAIHDVIVDLRRDSPTFRRTFAAELTADNRRALYVPKGFAHGFQTLADDTDVFYEMTARYEKNASRGVRWNDPAFAIEWPIANPIVSARDAAYPDFA